MKVDPDKDKIKIDKIVERLKTVVERCRSDVLSPFLEVNDFQVLEELNGGAVMAPISIKASAHGIDIERTVTMILPIGSKVAALDDDRSQWSLAMVGRKRTQVKKKRERTLTKKRGTIRI